ncbi:MAG: cell surface protein [Polyangiaceae bacterium]
MYRFWMSFSALAFASAVVACSSSEGDAKSSQNNGDSGVIDLGGDSGSQTNADAGTHPVDEAGSYPYDGGTLAADRFATTVMDFTPGACGGFGSDGMPTVVEGPPVGGGASEGSLDVLSLGTGGSITLSFAPNAIVDGPGADFTVFENAFLTNASDPSTVYAEPAEVSVSDDGKSWTPFPCTATAYPYGACAGWHPVLSSPSNGIDPADPAAAGGDAFDLSSIGVTHARFVRIVDKSGEACPTTPPLPIKNGFDLDAVVIVNAETP